MRQVVWRAYCDYEAEEKWLNEMSAKGMALVHYSWCRYVFEDAPPSQFIYRIELLKNMPTHPESMDYLRFLEESGVECVATYMRWVYLRNKTTAFTFDIYTDIDSRINHYKRIYSLLITIMFVEFAAGLSNLSLGLFHINAYQNSSDFSYVNLTLGLFLILLGFLFFRLGQKTRKKIKILEQEKIIRE